MEAHAVKKVVPTILRENVGRLSKLVGLSATDCRILEFAVMIRNESLLDETCDRLGNQHAQCPETNDWGGFQ